MIVIEFISICVIQILLFLAILHDYIHALTDSLTYINVQALPGIIPPWNIYSNKAFDLNLFHNQDMSEIHRFSMGFKKELVKIGDSLYLVVLIYLLNSST